MRYEQVSISKFGKKKNQKKGGSHSSWVILGRVGQRRREFHQGGCLVSHGIEEI